MKVEKREIHIQNVVASASLKHHIDLDAIVKAFPHVNYQPKVFPGLVFRLEKPKTCTLIIVASGSLGGPVDLEELASEPAGGSLMYEPEQFPAAVYRMESPRVVFLIFSVGKIVCVGAKKEDVYEAVENLRLRLEERKVLV